MKKFLLLLVAFSVLLSFSACFNSQPDAEPTTEAQTTQSFVVGENNDYVYEEYADHVVLTQLKSKSSTVWLPRTINNKPVTSFGKIFQGNFTLNTIFIPGNYTEIEDEAFMDCFKLHSLTIEKGKLKSIGSKAFLGCQLLKYASIPENVTEIAEDAFKYCNDLFIYGKTGSAIEEYAAGCYSIYFRDKEEDTTVAETTKPESEEESSKDEKDEETTKETDKETKKETTTKPKATSKPKATTEKETTTEKSDDRGIIRLPF